MPRPPHRILFVDHTARMGGGEVALLNLVTALDRRRYTPVVLLFADGPLREKLVEAHVETHVLPLSADVADARKDSLGTGTLLKLTAVRKTIGFTWRVYQFIRRLRPDVVHTNSLKADLIGGFAGRLARRPVIWHVRDRIADDYLPRTIVRAFRWLAGWVPQLVIANSRSTLSTLDKSTHDVANPSGINDPKLFKIIHDGTRPEDADGTLDLPPDKVLRVGLVGRLTRWKGQHVFIEAAGLLREKFPGARYQIIGSALFGEDAYEAECRAAVARLGLDDAVEFMGFRQDVRACIGRLDVLVHASITGEPFGQVIIEGMAAAKPVVATRGGGVPEIVVEGVTGFLVTMGDAAQMADAIARLLGDASLRAEMGRRGRLRVINQFTIRHTVEQVQSVYDQLLGNRR